MSESRYCRGSGLEELRENHKQKIGEGSLCHRPDSNRESLLLKLRVPPLDPSTPDFHHILKIEDCKFLTVTCLLQSLRSIGLWGWYITISVTILDIIRSRSRSYFTTDSQSVYMSWCRVPFGAHDQILLFPLPENCFALRLGAHSLTRGRVCNL
jgi:hypothetical protein